MLHPLSPQHPFLLAPTPSRNIEAPLLTRLQRLHTTRALTSQAPRARRRDNIEARATRSGHRRRKRSGRIRALVSLGVSEETLRLGAVDRALGRAERLDRDGNKVVEEESAVATCIGQHQSDRGELLRKGLTPRIRSRIPVADSEGRRASPIRGRAIRSR
jgi:hypothetical protein